MKIFILVLSFIVFSVNSYADLYVVIDKETGDINGVTSISDKHLSSWESKHTMIPVSEEYRGKHSYEIKLEDGKLRLSTTEEVDTYKQGKENVLKAKKKLEALEVLGLSESDLSNIKGLKK